MLAIYAAYYLVAGATAYSLDDLWLEGYFDEDYPAVVEVAP